MMTIGHSTLEIEAFLAGVRENGCTTLVDVRRFPGSRRHPQFGQDGCLRRCVMRGFVRCGGRGWAGGGRLQKDSVNTGWRNGELSGVCGLYADALSLRRRLGG